MHSLLTLSQTGNKIQKCYPGVTELNGNHSKNDWIALCPLMPMPMSSIHPGH